MLLTRKKLQMKQEVQFALKGEYITLDALMKAAGLAGTGGEAKVRIHRDGAAARDITAFCGDLTAKDA